MARTAQDTQIRMTEILQTAERLFMEKGYSGTTIADIAKSMGVAQGMCYYYFKSKEEILEVLLNRHASSFVAEIKDLACADEITSYEKIGCMLQIMLEGICYKNKALLHIVNDAQNLRIKDQLQRQVKQALAPWGLQIIEEGGRRGCFISPHPQTSFDVIMKVIEFLIESVYEKIPDELLALRLQMAARIVETALRAPEGTIQIYLTSV